jgi:hypothetical protein
MIPLLLLAVPAPAGAAAVPYSQVNFDDQARMVTLIIPTPACQVVAHTTSCNWELFVNEPDVPGQPVVSAVFGTSGVLSVPYPALCGVLQADALVGSPPRKDVGHQHEINTCNCVRPHSPHGAHLGATDTKFAQVNFADQARMVTLTIPTPACRQRGHTTSCNWELFVNEPDVPGQPVVGAVFGTSGVLSVPYPSGCGTLQADALVGTPPHKVVGHRHVVNTCGCAP